MKYVRIMREEDWIGSHPKVGKVRVKGNAITAVPDEILDVIIDDPTVTTWSQQSELPDYAPEAEKCEFLEAPHLDAQEFHEPIPDLPPVKRSHKKK